VEQDGFVLKVAPLGAAAADVHGHIEGAWKGVESKPTQHRLHRLSHRLHGKNLNALCRTSKCLSCAKRHTILIGVICDLICAICVIWMLFFLASPRPCPQIPHPRRSEASPWCR
jgi:hypothetical protein